MSGLAASTVLAYRSGLHRFLAFCHRSGLSPFPLAELTLCRFVAYLWDQQLSVGSIRLYLSALRYFQIAQGGCDPSLSSLARLHYVLRGISRAQPVSLELSRGAYVQLACRSHSRCYGTCFGPGWDPLPYTTRLCSGLLVPWGFSPFYVQENSPSCQAGVKPC